MRPSHLPDKPWRAELWMAFRLVLVVALVALAVFACSSAAHAAGSGMPWEAPLTSILESIEGPVARIIAVIIIVITGLSLAFGETSGGFRRLIQIVFGLSIAFAATSFFLSFFSFGGGALIA
jgi:type IV secretion system protein VirB2